MVWEFNVTSSPPFSGFGLGSDVMLLLVVVVVVAMVAAVVSAAAAAVEGRSRWCRRSRSHDHSRSATNIIRRSSSSLSDHAPVATSYARVI